MRIIPQNCRNRNFPGPFHQQIRSSWGSQFGLIPFNSFLNWDLHWCVKHLTKTSQIIYIYLFIKWASHVLRCSLQPNVFSRYKMISEAQLNCNLGIRQDVLSVISFLAGINFEFILISSSLNTQWSSVSFQNPHKLCILNTSFNVRECIYRSLRGMWWACVQVQVIVQVGLFSTDIGATSFQDAQEAETWVKDPENSSSYLRRSGGRSV